MDKVYETELGRAARKLEKEFETLSVSNKSGYTFELRFKGNGSDNGRNLGNLTLHYLITESAVGELATLVDEKRIIDAESALRIFNSSLRGSQYNFNSFDRTLGTYTRTSGDGKYVFTIRGKPSSFENHVIIEVSPFIPKAERINPAIQKPLTRDKGRKIQGSGSSRVYSLGTGRNGNRREDNFSIKGVNNRWSSYFPKTL